MEDESETSADSNTLCLQCISDEFVRVRAKPHAKRARCSYCQRIRSGISISALAEIVDEDLRANISQGEDVPHSSLDSDKVYYEQDGESLVDVLQEELEIDFEPAQDLAEVLIDKDPAWPGDGEEPFYASDQNYKRYYSPGIEYGETWKEFSERIKHERRFFDAVSAKKLESIFGAPGSLRVVSLPVFEVGEAREASSVFRARKALSSEEALKFLKNPRKELGPPPRELALASRMNAAGISVFYGALSLDTAVAEVRPFVGGLVVGARFSPTRTLRLLDFTKLGTGSTGSIFDPEYQERVSRMQFLQGFHALIARPVQPGEESLAYIPTQAVAEYVANVLGFDGLLYASAQVGAVPEEDYVEGNYDPPTLGPDELRAHNVVLFGSAGRVAGDQAEPNALTLKCELVYEDKTATVRRVQSIKYSHDETWLFDPAEGLPF